MDSDLEKILSEIGTEIDDEVNEDSLSHFEYHEDDEFVNDNEDSELEGEISGEIADPIKSDEIEKGDLENKINEQVDDTLEKQKVESSSKKTAVSEFTTKGTKLWNTREPYFISIDSSKFSDEHGYLKTSFFFTHKTYKNDSLEQDVKKYLAKYLRNPSKNILENYKEFIFKMVIYEIEKLCSYFTIDDKMRNLFIYHLGPLNLFNIIFSKMKKNNYGICYRYTDKNRAVSFFPDEFIKDKVLFWFEVNINSISLQFDSLQKLNEINDIIQKQYQQEKKKFLNKLNLLNSKLAPKKSISSKELLKLKGNQWFGFSNIFVYKRFVEKSIFMNY